MALTRIIYCKCNQKPDEGDLQNARHDAMHKHCIVRIIWYQQFVGERHVDIDETMSIKECIEAVNTICTNALV